MLEFLEIIKKKEEEERNKVGEELYENDGCSSWTKKLSSEDENEFVFMMDSHYNLTLRFSEILKDETEQLE